jgi:hypothetical protein
MHGDYKMFQTEMHEFAIRDKPGGTLRATIIREPDGAWSTHSHDEPAPEFELQKNPQAAFDAFVRSLDPTEVEVEGDASAER